MRQRKAARIIALDGTNRVLLLQYARPNGERFWATPGGGLEEQETFELAAAREVAEELGLHHVHLSPLWVGTATFQVGPEIINQEEKFFLLRIEGHQAMVNVEDAHRREGILQFRWWTVLELQCTGDVMFPDDLALRLSAITALGERAGRP